MPNRNPESELLKVDEIFQDCTFCALVPDGFNPEDMINLFDHPEKLVIMIDFNATIICLKDYQSDVLHLLKELRSDVLDPINGAESETRILN
jgi:hypothetical protein